MSVFLMMNRGRSGRGMMGVSAKDLKDGEDMISYTIEMMGRYDKRVAACPGHEASDWTFGLSGEILQMFQKEKRCVHCDKFFQSQKRSLTIREKWLLGWSQNSVQKMWAWQDNNCPHKKVVTRSKVHHSYSTVDRYYWRECAKCHKPMSHFHSKPLKKWHENMRQEFWLSVMVAVPVIYAIICMMH